MKRFAIAMTVCACSLAFAARAADKAPAGKATTEKAAAGGEPGNVMPCGDMIKNHVIFPTKMAELMTAIADNLEGHAKWMGTVKGSKEAKAEADALRKIAKDHRDLAAAMKKAAATMEKASSIAPAPHDMKTMDPKAGESMMKQAALEKEIGGMMQKDASEMEKMVKGMAAGGGEK
jgi:hypothetical protein